MCLNWDLKLSAWATVFLFVWRWVLSKQYILQAFIGVLHCSKCYWVLSVPARNPRMSLIKLFLAGNTYVVGVFRFPGWEYFWFVPGSEAKDSKNPRNFRQGRVWSVTSTIHSINFDSINFETYKLCNV